jgi:hypothetical protein
VRKGGDIGEKKKQVHLPMSPCKQELASLRYSCNNNVKGKLIHNLIELKELEIQWMQDSLFEDDELYIKFIEKLRIELGHYISIAHNNYV